MVSQKNLGFWYTVCKGKNLRKSKEKLKYRESKKLSKKHIFLRVFSKITISVCVFCAFFISPVFATLPAGFTELEYIESTGTQYIDTEFQASSSTNIEVKCYLETVSSSDGFLFGSYENGKKYAINLFSDNAIYPRFGINSSLALSRYYIKTNQVFKVIDGKFYINDTLLIDYSTESFTKSTLNLWLFSNNGNAKNFRGRIMYTKIWDNNELVRNFVPARRDSDNEIGMYDTVSGIFFTNAGTGDFIAGPVAEIKIATTKMVDEEFAAAEAKLATTVQTIESVVSRTISQTEQIRVLQEEKQTRPDESCPANMKCLLVQDEDGTPHWYPIIEP
ncbi:MAG: hypothetical protein MJ164_00275 [Alphaproteobacteria bacterium]|nr:hypothetical protein [Alphaproteobacteria bacterium]